MTVLRIRVLGEPVPQGSKVARQSKGQARAMIVDANAKILAPWRDSVAAAADDARRAGGYTPLDEPVRVVITFYLTRPGGHYGTGRNAGELRASAPPLPDRKPDLDKLTRAILDGLTTARVYRDDARVVDLAVFKRYADGDTMPGAAVEVSPCLKHSPRPPAADQGVLV